jgi:hypothetical protein
MVRRFGYEAETVEGGEEAQTKVKKNKQKQKKSETISKEKSK